MNVLFNLLRKDARRLRGPWLGFVAVLLAKVGLGGWFIFAGQVADLRADRVEWTLVTLTVLQIGLTWFLAVRLVHADSLTSARAWWPTRPISGARLLAAKALGALLLLGLTPVVLWLPWWLVNGFGVRSLALAAGETLFWQALIVVPAALLASLVGSFSRVGLWSLALGAGATVGWLWLAIGPGVQTESALVQVAIAIGLTLALSPLLLAGQYLTRRTRPVAAFSSIATVLVMLAAMLTGVAWPLPQWPWSERNAASGEEVRARMTDPNIYRWQAAPQRRDQSSLYIEWAVDGSPRGTVTVLGWGVAPHGAVWPGGAEPVETFAIGDRWSEQLDWSAFIRSSGAEVRNWLPRFASSFVTGRDVPVQRMRQEALVVEATLPLRLVAPHLVEDRPLETNGWRIDDDAAWRVSVPGWRGKGWQVVPTLVSCRRASVLRDWFLMWRDQRAGGSEPERCYVLFDPETGEHELLGDARGESRWLGAAARRVLSDERMSDRLPDELQFAGVRVRRAYGGYRISSRKTRSDDLRLVIVEAREVARITREARAEFLPLDPAYRKTTPATP